MMEEMNRRREECIQLRTLLGRSPMGVSQVVREAYGGNSKLVNEDGELEMAYKTQKELNK
jgi:myosin-5